jgi:regulation of enolase protein 1 (concanavalin A-like superfamily)
MSTRLSWSLALTLLLAGCQTSTPQSAAPAAQPQEAAPAAPAVAVPAWHWFDPGDDAEYRLEGDRIVVTAPDGNDLWPDFNFAAPRLTRTQEGDFSIQVRAEVKSRQVYNGAGLVAQSGPDTIVRLERGNPGGKHGVGLTGYMAGRYEKNGGGFNTEATDVFLKLVRQGDTFTGYARAADESEWRKVGSLTLALPATLEVGPALVNQQSGAPFSATFTDVRFETP